MKFDLVLDSDVELAETPIWDARDGGFYWTEAFTGNIHLYQPESKTGRKWETGQMIGSAVPCDDAYYLFVSLETGMFVLDKNTGKLELIAEPEPGHPENRYNDTRIDARGRIFTSSVAKAYGSDGYRPDMLGNFYMVDTDGSVHTVQQGINQYNAMVWNADNTKLFVVDTYNQKLMVFDYDLASGPVGQPKVGIDFAEQGMPDGMSIDTQGNLYICHWTGKISVWDSSLNFKEEWNFPVPQVCCGGFGGASMKEFYVATAQYGLTPEEKAKYPGSGGFFMTRTEIAGKGDNYYKLTK